MENEPIPTNKAELLDQIRVAYRQLEETIRLLSPEQMSQPGPNNGWAISDHLAHLTEWRRKLLAMIHGRPGYEGLRIDASTYQTAGLDGINEILYQRNRARSPHEALADLRQAHADVLTAIAAIREADLARPYDLTDPSDPRKLLEGIAGNTYLHDREHRAWILTLLEALPKT